MGIKKEFIPEKGICRVRFTLHESILNHANRVAIVGDFNSWQTGKHLMRKNKDGHFTAKIELPIGKVYQFRYLIDKYTWDNEWDADGLVNTPYEEAYNSVINCKEGEKLA